MKKINYLFPTILIDSLRLIKNFIPFISYTHVLKRNKQYKNIKKGKTVFIIANGPSLNNFDIPSLYGKEVIVMNNFNFAEWKEKVNIVAHCIGEPKDSNQWGVDQIEIIKETEAQAYWFHISVLKDVEEKNKSINKNCNYVFPIIPPGLWNNKSKINLAMPVLGYQTTAQMALMVAIYMGYKKINLIGFDHDWLCHRDEAPHFYEKKDSIKKDILSTISYYKLIKISEMMWKIYYKIKYSAINSGSEITNLSSPSYLDVFD